MRRASIDNRSMFMGGVGAGLVFVLVKLLVFLPIDIANYLYASCLFLTLVITFGDLFRWDAFTGKSRSLDFVLGLLVPLDAYAIVILYGLPLPD